MNTASKSFAPPPEGARHSRLIPVPRDLRVLIVEDEPADAMMIERLLTRVEGFRITTSRAADLSTARSAVAHDNFDVAFIDYDLAGQCGVDLVPRLSESGCDCAPVLITGQLTEDVHQRALAGGMLASLSKDHLDVSTLEAAMRQALHANELVAQLKALVDELGQMRRQKLDISATLPLHLVDTLRLLVLQAASVEHGLAERQSPRHLAAELRTLRYLADDLKSYCEDSLRISRSLETGGGASEIFDIQSALLDAMSAIDAARRSRNVNFKLELHEAPLYVQANQSTLKLALSDLLASCLERVRPGGQLSLRLGFDDKSVALALLCNDVSSSDVRAVLQSGRLIARCRALLERCEATIEFPTTFREDGSIAIMRMPHPIGNRQVIARGGGEDGGSRGRH